LAGLVNQSRTGAGDHYRFKLQPIRTQTEGETIEIT
jgi:hypothetical protein